MFRVLSDIHLDSGSVRIIPITRNTTKQDPFGIYVGFGSVRIHFYRIGFSSGFRVRFICPALTLILKSPNNLSFFFLRIKKFFLILNKILKMIIQLRSHVLAYPYMVTLNHCSRLYYNMSITCIKLTCSAYHPTAT